MNRENRKSLLVGIPLFAVLFVGSYLWRKYRDDDISTHEKYTISYIYKKTGSLKSGNQWHYKFYYENILHESYRSTHIDYDVNLGDSFLVSFSRINPNHNKIHYEYKLRPLIRQLDNNVWDTIPKNLIMDGLKK